MPPRGQRIWQVGNVVLALPGELESVRALLANLGQQRVKFGHLDFEIAEFLALLAREVHALIGKALDGVGSRPPCRRLTIVLVRIIVSLSRLIEGRLPETCLKAEPGAAPRRRGS